MKARKKYATNEGRIGLNKLPAKRAFFFLLEDLIKKWRLQ
jgi:hypothetical protein